MVPLNPLPLHCSSPPSLFSLVATNLFSICGNLFLFKNIFSTLLLFYIFHVQEISYCICFSLWLISLSIITSESIHFAANGKYLSVLEKENSYSFPWHTISWLSPTHLSSPISYTNILLRHVYITFEFQ